MANVKVTVNHGAARDLLRSRQVEADLRRRAQQIASAAGEGFAAESSIGRNRARASAFTATWPARRAEAVSHSLLRALDAGRG